MTVLVLGARGTTGSRLARQLTDRHVDVRRAGRSAGTDVYFDWSEPDTFAPSLHGVGAVYLLAPVGVVDPEPVILPFLGAAEKAGVERVALLGSSAIPMGSPGLGTVGTRLRDFVPGWAVLRPTWFASNFTGDHLHARTIRSHGEIVSATGDGRVPFIDPDDIAAVARRVLVGPAAPQRDLILTGPEPLSFDDVAAQLTRPDRAVRHRRVTEAEMSRRLREDGIPPAFADLLAGMDTAIARGAEDRTTGTVEEITGRPPRSFARFSIDS